MTLTTLMTSLLSSSVDSGSPNLLTGFNGKRLSVYPLSVRMERGVLFFIGKEQGERFLYLLSTERSALGDFCGAELPAPVFGHGVFSRRCPLNHANANLLREIFPFTRPVTLGLADSFGFGDRLGLANPAHLRALTGSSLRPVLAQQSIRELDRTQRTAEDVLDAASWAVFQEGYSTGFAADGDHLKSVEDIDRMARAGFTMFTFDPGAFVVNEAASLAGDALRSRAEAVTAGGVFMAEVLARYRDQSLRIGVDDALHPGEDEILRAYVKYAGVIARAAVLYRHLMDHWGGRKPDVELSVDETDLPTTPFEHYFVANELKTLGVVLTGLAPRFLGNFEKGIDYRGDLAAFAADYRRHAAVAAIIGPYKLSIHSGSDKFSVYEVIGRLRCGPVHVKTAGTSYLEALRTVGAVEPALLREILAFARGVYDEEKRTYHVSATLERVPKPADCSDEMLLGILDEENARQVFHVTFGKVLTARDPGGKYIFRTRLYECLEAYEADHYAAIVRHFRKHLTPFDRRDEEVR